jgi:Fe-S-cluster containining protein
VRFENRDSATRRLDWRGGQVTMSKATEVDRAAKMSLLCCSCGFCCDGSLNFFAELEPEQAEAARGYGLDVRETRLTVGFRLPCSQLHARRCAVYDCPDRPEVCRTYRCWLSQRFMEGRVTAEQAALTIGLVDSLRKVVAAHIGRERTAGWVRGAKRCHSGMGVGDNEVSGDERRRFAEAVANVPGAIDETGTVNAELLASLLAAGRVLHREFVWPEEARERMLKGDTFR